MEGRLQAERLGVGYSSSIVLDHGDEHEVDALGERVEAKLGVALKYFPTGKQNSG